MALARSLNYRMVKYAAEPKLGSTPETNAENQVIMGEQENIKAGRLHEGLSFNEKVWALTARIPQGKVTTYAQIAHKLGGRGYRAVGNALNRNPYAPAVPCHRVVGSRGQLTGFFHGVEQKRRLLAREGVPFVSDRVDLSRCLFEF